MKKQRKSQRTKKHLVVAGVALLIAGALALSLSAFASGPSAQEQRLAQKILANKNIGITGIDERRGLKRLSEGRCMQIQVGTHKGKCYRLSSAMLRGLLSLAKTEKFHIYDLPASYSTLNPNRDGNAVKISPGKPVFAKKLKKAGAYYTSVYNCSHTCPGTVYAKWKN